MLAFFGLSMDKLGYESLYRNISKMSALSWTRCLYRQPSLAEQIWIHWGANLQVNNPALIATTLPAKWQKISYIANNVIKACPFCNAVNNNSDRISGNLEHLHLYCSATYLVAAQSHCNQKIEDAIVNLYNYASLREYNTSAQNALQKSTLQERMEQAAKRAELLERLIVSGNKLYFEARPDNMAILTENSILRAIAMGKLHEEKIIEYRTYPHTHRLGFMHSIPEQELKMERATITDVGFLGLFPKPILEVLHIYNREVKKDSNDSDTFTSLIDKLISAFIYRPIMLQKTIQLMIVQKKKQLAKDNNTDPLRNVLGLQVNDTSN
jgi:hypothetical protein